MRFARRLVAVAMVWAATANAQDAISDHIGMLGLGYFNADAPIGVRLWMGPTFGVEAGTGFETDAGVAISRPGGTDTVNLHHFAIEGALLLPLRSESNTIFFFRPGFGFFRRQEVFGAAGDQRRTSTSTFQLSGMLGLELFLSKLGFDNLSLGAGVGVALTHTDPPGSGGSSTSFGTVLAEVDVMRSSSLGFHYYF
jgi:hypothetical protein